MVLAFTAIVLFCRMPGGGLQRACLNAVFVLQVEALCAKREQKLEELKFKLNKYLRDITDWYLRKRLNECFDWIETAGQAATLKEINAKKEKIKQLVSLFFC